MIKDFRSQLKFIFKYIYKIKIGGFNVESLNKGLDNRLSYEKIIGITVYYRSYK